MRIVTRNVGLYTWMKYASLRRGKIGGQNIIHQHFHPEQTWLVNTVLKELQPDIVVFQEIEDKDYLKTIVRKEEDSIWDIRSSAIYTTAHLISHPIYQKKALISLHDVREEVHHTGIGEDLHVLMHEGIGIIPIHLDAFSAGKRRLQVQEICRFIDKVAYPVIILGDFNFRHRKEKFLYAADKDSYTLLSSRLYDTSKNLISTTPRWASFDKIFISPELFESASSVPGSFPSDIAPPQAQIIKKTWAYMDHYPVFVDIDL